MTTELVELIRTERRAGLFEDSVPVHRHTQFYTKSGQLVIELCDCTDCETLEPPEGEL